MCSHLDASSGIMKIVFEGNKDIFDVERVFK